MLIEKSKITSTLYFILKATSIKLPDFVIYCIAAL